MSRPSHSRQSSFSYAPTPSRRSSVSSNPNVFSDDYALEPIDSRLDLTLHEPNETDHTLADYDRTQDIPSITPYPAIPSRLSVLNRPNSISKRPIANDAASVSHDGATTRTLSTSSRFSFIRPQSPYSGPTQPSHPYAMYPQITRASSIASESTIRPRENPFVPTGGPEHPYSMYQQNTVPEDDDDNDIGSQPIPLGFPRLGHVHPASGATSRTDVGDIVGLDGHIEQLPPYTRYADNVVAKGDMANINDTSSMATSRRLSQRSTLVRSDTRSETRSLARSVAHSEARSEARSEQITNMEPSEQQTLLNEEEEKETWKDKANRRICGGISLWLLALIVALMLFAGVVGGLIGGILGKQKADSLFSATATGTIPLDADPAVTGTNIPACPTGRYTIPLKQTQDINNCIASTFPGAMWSWGCLDMAYLTITISDPVINNSKTLQVTFEDYSVDTTTFHYGPQPPDFNGSSFDLLPYDDKDDKELGVAMFFAQTFDKLSILPQYAISMNKRSVDERDVIERGMQHEGDKIQRGDQPWFCFWNSTVNEFWIFLQTPNQNPQTWNVSSSVTLPPASAAISTATSPATSYPTTPAPATTPSSSTSSVASAGSSRSSWSNGPFGGSFPPGSFPTPSVQKRDVYLTPYYPQYPQLVKMVEKRKPKRNVQPYCQQMQVLGDWTIVPNENKNIIFIQEWDYAQHPLDVGHSPRRRDTVTQEYQSNCVCEWVST